MQKQDSKQLPAPSAADKYRDDDNLIDREDQPPKKKALIDRAIEMKDIGKFKIQPDELKKIVELSGQARQECEEVDYLEDYFKKNKGDSNEINNNKYIKHILDGLCVNPLTGISKSEQFERDEIYGTNMKNPIKPKSFCQLLWMALQDETLKILSVAAIVSIITATALAHDEDERSIAWIEGFAILVAVIVCSNVAAINDFQKEKQFQKLNDKVSQGNTVQVLREGKTQEVNIYECIAGDIVNIKGGIEIPADGILIEGVDISADESAMTGESDPINKDSIHKCIERRNDLKKQGHKIGRHDIPSPVLLSGTSLLTGEGKMVCVVMGDKSTRGEIEKKLAEVEEEQTPLQAKLTHIANGIGNFGLYSAYFILFILFLRFIIERSSENSWDHSKHWTEIVRFFILAITVVVVAIPEGLPLSVTLSLAFSSSRMLEDKNLVRKLEACETMGGADNICSDKTGTLTENKMRLVQIFNEKQIELVISDKKDGNLKKDLEIESDEVMELLNQCLAINSTASLNGEKSNPTELGILKYLDQCGVDIEEYRRKYEKIDIIPFNSSRKRMSTVIKNSNGKYMIMMKGASEQIIQTCQNIQMFKGGQPKIFEKQHIEHQIEKMAEKALRTIGVAYKFIEPESDLVTKDEYGVRDIEKDGFTLLCILGIKDNLRKGVKESIKILRFQSQITVRMVTGDNEVTAKAIALDAGIITDKDINAMVLKGETFMDLIGGVICSICSKPECKCPINLDDAKKQRDEKLKESKGQKENNNVKDKQDNSENKEEKEIKDLEKLVRKDVIKNEAKFKELAPNLLVLARSRPLDKYAIVTGLRNLGHVVAVTGDGTNDAPALKKADVGFAMGIAGTQVAKDASSIILTDDNFNSIVAAVKWGRNIYDSIRKFLQFQLTVNVVAVGVTIVGAATLKQELLKPIQMLWVNLIMDTFASLALATEPPLDKLLDRPPHGRNSSILSKKMTKHIAMQSVLQMVILFIMSFYGENFLPEYKDDFDDEPGFQVNWKYNMEYYPDTLYVRSGRARTFDGTEEDYPPEAYKKTPSRHYTYIFNTFVLLQFFNFLNARKIEDEFNIMHGIFNNIYFFFMLLIIIVFQIIFVTFGGRAFDCYMYFGLTFNQWLVCIGFGLTGNVWNFFIKFIPDGPFSCFEKTGIDSEDNKESFVSHLIEQKRKNSLTGAEGIAMQHSNKGSHHAVKRQQGPIE